MQKTLTDLRDKFAAEEEAARKAQKEAQNLTSNFRENNKRSDVANNVDDGECMYPKI